MKLVRQVKFAHQLRLPCSTPTANAMSLDVSLSYPCDMSTAV